MYDKILKKWNSSESNDPFFIKSLKSYNQGKKYIQNFNYSLTIHNGIIKSKIGVGISLLNEYTVSSVAYNYSIFLHKQKIKNILVTHDGSFHAILFSKVFASTLIDEKINAYFNFNNQAVNDASSLWIAQNSQIKFDAVVTFSRLYSNNNYVISFYKKDGLLLSYEESKEISNYIWNTSYLNIGISSTNVPQIEENLNNSYLNHFQFTDLSNISILISNPFNFNEEILKNFLRQCQIECKIVNFKSIPKAKNEITRKSLMKTFNKETDAIVNFIENNNSFEFVIKHKKRKKFLTLNDLAVIYMYYQFQITENKDIKDKTILNSFDSSSFINFYGKKNKLKVETLSQFYNDLNQFKIQDVFLATNGDNFFVTSQNCSFVSDPLLNIQIFLEMVSYFKKQNKTLYDILIEIYQREKTYRLKKYEETMKSDTASIFFNRLEKKQKIADVLIIRKKYLDQKKKVMEIILEDKTSIIFEYLEDEMLLKTFFSIWNSDKKDLNVEQSYVNLIVKEKLYFNYINDLKRDFNIKKFSIKAMIKYTIFVIIFALFLWFIFTFIFGADKKLFEQINNFLKAEYIYGYLLPLVSLLGLTQLSIACWSNKRMLSILKQKVKWRHLAISNLISICISTITPLVYGGETISYWYLRRKNIQRAPLAAMFLVQSLLFQISLVIYSIIFIPIAITTFFPSLLLNDSANFRLLVVLIIAGFIMDIFSAIMIFILTFNAKFQKIIVKSLNKFSEWIPFIVTKDAAEKGAKIQFEFSSINKAAKEIFTSNVWYINVLIFIEFLLYKLGSRLLDWGSIFAIITNMIKPGYFAGGFFNMLAGNALIRCVNAVNFITPGGLGISDWATKNILYPMFIDGNNSSNSLDFRNINVHQTLNRIIFTITWVVLSALMLLTVYIGESRIDRYKRIRNTLTEKEIRLGNIKTKTTFYKQSIFYWTFGIIGGITTWSLVFYYVIL